MKTKVLLITFFSLLFYGLAIEVLQYAFFENRYFEIFDLIANIIGLFAGTLVFSVFFKYF